MKRHVLPVWLSLVSGCGAASSATGGGTLLVVFQRKGESLELRITFE